MRTRDQISEEIATVRANGTRLNNLQNERADGYDHMDVTRLTALATEMQDAIDAEWTRDVTQSRRAEWNNAARSGKYRTPGKISAATGINESEMVAAIKRHQL